MWNSKSKPIRPRSTISATRTSVEADEGGGSNLRRRRIGSRSGCAAHRQGRPDLSSYDTRSMRSVLMFLARPAGFAGDMVLQPHKEPHRILALSFWRTERGCRENWELA